MAVLPRTWMPSVAIRRDVMIDLICKDPDVPRPKPLPSGTGEKGARGLRAAQMAESHISDAAAAVRDPTKAPPFVPHCTAPPRPHAVLPSAEGQEKEAVTFASIAEAQRVIADHGTQRVSLKGARLATQDIESFLVGWGGQRKLSHLDLSHALSGSFGAARVAEILSGPESTVVALSLAGNPESMGSAIPPYPGDVKQAELVAAALQRATAIKRLDLSDNALGAPAAKALLEGLRHNKSVEVLLLGGNRMAEPEGEDEWSPLCDLLMHNKFVTSLSLRDNGIDPRAAGRLCEALASSNTVQPLPEVEPDLPPPDLTEEIPKDDEGEGEAPPAEDAEGEEAVQEITEMVKAEVDRELEKSKEEVEEEEEEAEEPQEPQ
eukprot:Sspe_Gene.69833::Locus_41208_Transcript_1_1_Confidence_1.000_Length_3160::g.69833::m.69833